MTHSGSGLALALGVLGGLGVGLVGPAQASPDPWAKSTLLPPRARPTNATGGGGGEVRRAALPRGKTPELELEALEARLERDRSDPRVFYRVAEIRQSKGDARGALKALDEAYRLDSKHPQIRLALGKALLKRTRNKDRARGRRLLLGLLEEGQENSSVYLALYDDARGRGKDSEADHFMNRARDLSPQDPEVLYRAGTHALHQGENSAALKQFRAVLKIRPDHGKARLAEALVFERFGEDQRALESFALAHRAFRRQPQAQRDILRRMRALDPYSDPAKVLALAASNPQRPQSSGSPLPKGLEDRSQGLLDQVARARRLGRGTLLETSEPPRTLAPKPGGDARAPGEVRLDLPTEVPRKPRPEPEVSDRTPKIEASGDGLLDLSAPDKVPNDSSFAASPAKIWGADAYRRSARIFEEHGLYSEATSAWYALISASPSSPEARQAREAIEVLRRRPWPEETERIQSLRILAARMLDRGDLPMAKDALERILYLRPKDPVALKDLAYLAVEKEDLREGLLLLEKALEARPGYPEALVIQGLALAKQRKFRRARVIYQAVLEGGPPERIRVYAESMLHSLRLFSEEP